MLRIEKQGREHVLVPFGQWWQEEQPHISNQQKTPEMTSMFSFGRFPKAPCLTHALNAGIF
jgi:hypothetical protein